MYTKRFVHPSRKPLHGFTLVELLVVISIIALLIALLLPALAKARSMARRTACAFNVRSLTMATLMYADENQDVLMAQGSYQYGLKGVVGTPTNTSLLAFFHEYFDVSDRYTAGGTTTTGMAGIALNVTYHTPATFICPSAPLQPNYNQITYGYMTGSCFPTGPGADGEQHPYAMTVTALQWAGRVASQGFHGGPPALWADLYFVDDPPQTWWSGPTHTNHPGVGGLYGPGGGGNVGRVDGSVVWMPLSQSHHLGLSVSQGADYHDEYGLWDGWDNIQALPYDTICLPVDGNDNVDAPYGVTPDGYYYGAFPGAY